MTRSAVTFTLHAEATDALLVMAHPCRCATEKVRTVLVVALMVLLALALPSSAKHVLPPQVGAVTNNGVRYVVPNDRGLRAYVEAWDAQSGQKLWVKTIFKHWYIPIPFGPTECMHYEYLISMSLQADTLILTSDGARTFSLDTRTRRVRRVKIPEPDKAAAGNARFAPQFAVAATCI